MRKWIVFSLVIISMLACSNKKKLPEGILAQPQMREVMWDMMRVGEFLNGYVLFRDSNVNHAAVSEKWYDKVFEIHHITRDQFNRSYAYYREHPPVMRELLDSLSKKPVLTPSSNPSNYGQHISGDSIGPRPIPAGAAKRAFIDSLRLRGRATNLRPLPADTLIP